MTPQTPSDIGYLVYGEQMYPIRRVTMQEGQVMLWAEYRTAHGEEHGLPPNPSFMLVGVDGHELGHLAALEVPPHMTAAHGGVLTIAQPLTITEMHNAWSAA